MPTTYKHVLTAIDMYHDDLPVVKQGLGLMRSNSADLTIATVIPNIPYYMASGLSSVSDIEDQLEKDSHDQLDEIKSKINVEANYRILHGSPKLEIVKLANEINADIIVVGSHGQNGVQRLLGSTATGVLHRASCDVMVVRIKD